MDSSCLGLMEDTGVCWRMHSHLLVDIRLSVFRSRDNSFGKPDCSGVWAKKEHYSLALSLSSDTKIILDSHLSVTHLFIILPSSFHLSLILTRTKDVRFSYYDDPVPTIMSQEMLAFPSIFLRFNLPYWHLLYFNIKFIGVFLVIQFSKFFPTGIDGSSLQVFFTARALGRTHWVSQSWWYSAKTLVFLQQLLFPFHVFTTAKLFSLYLAQLVFFSVDSPSFFSFYRIVLTFLES